MTTFHLFDRFIHLRYHRTANEKLLESHYQVLYTYPRKKTKEIVKTELFYLKDFCFYDVNNTDFSLTNGNKQFSFIITEYKTGEFLYVFVSRTQDLSKNTLDSCMFITTNPFKKFFRDLLDLCEKKIQYSHFLLNCLLHNLYHLKRFDILTKKEIVFPVSRFKNEQDIINLCQETFHTSRSLHALSKIGGEKLSQIFNCIFSEIKLIAISSKIHKLSNFIHLLIEVIKPFKWEFPLISFTPEKLIENIQSPTALIMGVERKIYERNLEMFSTEEFYLFDLDYNRGSFRFDKKNGTNEDYKNISTTLLNEKEFLIKEITDYRKKIRKKQQKKDYHRLDTIFRTYIDYCLKTFNSLYLTQNRVTQLYSGYLTNEKKSIQQGILSFKNEKLKATWYKYVPNFDLKWNKLSDNLVADLDVHYFYYLKHFLNKDQQRKKSSQIKLDSEHIVDFDSMVLTTKGEQSIITRSSWFYLYTVNNQHQCRPLKEKNSVQLENNFRKMNFGKKLKLLDFISIKNIKYQFCFAELGIESHIIRIDSQIFPLIRGNPELVVETANNTYEPKSQK
ncbi:suppression of tumorigenicity 5 st5 [Anaeramoeba flamelloides]|uniref:Suppression of tumorigenicity 5 st5 n=1 Tax=Anaeramoeba flamelloides TaxID=1746091 RepID=A0AAV7Z2B4_9EUKA|nr:suppression of tumorigenicity 5 st5 [Anaeramoeba flamelloides]